MRTPIDRAIAARTMFEFDRTCCICRQRGKRVQIHHIDGDHNNSTADNLAVLCLECHTETQIGGGFFRKLDADQVILYKDSWLEYVASMRSPRNQAEAFAIDDKSQDRTAKLLELVESAKENNDYFELVHLFDMYNKRDLRNKYIDILLQADNDIETQIYYRSMQGRLDLLDMATVDKYLAQLEAEEDLQRLARNYKHLGKAREAVAYHCKHIIRAIAANNIFNAAYILRELSEAQFDLPLFEEALHKSQKEGDLWWQVRALQELGWRDELIELLRENRDLIEKSNHPNLKFLIEEHSDEITADA